MSTGEQRGLISGPHFEAGRRRRGTEAEERRVDGDERALTSRKEHARSMRDNGISARCKRASARHPRRVFRGLHNPRIEKGRTRRAQRGDAGR